MFIFSLSSERGKRIKVWYSRLASSVQSQSRQCRFECGRKKLLVLKATRLRDLQPRMNRIVCKRNYVAYLFHVKRERRKNGETRAFFFIGREGLLC